MKTDICYLTFSLTKFAFFFLNLLCFIRFSLFDPVYVG